MVSWFSTAILLPPGRQSVRQSEDRRLTDADFDAGWQNANQVPGQDTRRGEFEETFLSRRRRRNPLPRERHSHHNLLGRVVGLVAFDGFDRPVTTSCLGMNHFREKHITGETVQSPDDQHHALH